jgi:hypothetical protein
MFNWFKKINKDFEETEAYTCTTTSYLKLTAEEAKQLADVKRTMKVTQMAACWAEKSYEAIDNAVDQGLYAVEVACPVARELTMEDLDMMVDIAKEYAKIMEGLGYEIEFNSTLYTIARVNWEGGGKQ